MVAHAVLLEYVPVNLYGRGADVELVISDLCVHFVRCTILFLSIAFCIGFVI